MDSNNWEELIFKAANSFVLELITSSPAAYLSAFALSSRVVGICKIGEQLSQNFFAFITFTSNLQAQASSAHGMHLAVALGTGHCIQGAVAFQFVDSTDSVLPLFLAAAWPSDFH